MYIHIAGVVLFCMAFAVAYPVFPSFQFLHPERLVAGLSVFTLSCGFAAFHLTLSRTGHYFKPRVLDAKELAGSNPQDRLRLWLNKNVVYMVNVAARGTLLLFVLLWGFLCTSQKTAGNLTYVGPFFSYRCLYPASGVSPLVPVLLILAAWYLWAYCQTLRLRFSKKNRPLLPGPVAGRTSLHLFVSDDDISNSGPEAKNSLTTIITCLLITRQVVKSLFRGKKWWPTLCLVGVYSLSFLILIFGVKVRSVDHFLWQSAYLSGSRLGRSMPAAYEFLVAALAFPLIIIALAGWLRTIMIWSSLKGDLLERLEQMPIRYAFTRIKGVGWINMMKQGGLLEQWRDMARSVESLRQMVNDADLLASFLPHHPEQKRLLLDTQANLDKWIGAIQEIAAEKRATDPQAELNCMVEIEHCFAKASEALLGGVLIPYWEEMRVGSVEGAEAIELPIRAKSLPKSGRGSIGHTPLELHTGTVSQEPMHIRVAEEFLAIRYLSLIRAVLVNLSRLLLFVSMAFVFTIAAWNSYPFQPRVLIDAAFTALLLLLGAGVVLVFAQMHRNPILSRITDTNANELGVDFYLRVIAFGTVPVLTWLAYQFPEVGGRLYQLITPGLGGLK